MGKFLILALTAFVSINAFAIRNGQSLKHQSNPNLVEFSIGAGTCTGVRISRDYILTAAHCFKMKPRRFHVFYINGSKKVRQKIEFKDVIFKGTNLSEELAIVPIDPPELNPAETHKFFSIFPYQLGALNSIDQFSIYGFGMNEEGTLGQLRVGQVQFTQHYVVPSKYTYPMLLVEPIKKSNMLACPGDSGGPIFTTKNGKTELLGIVSFIANTKRELHKLEAVEQCQLANLASYIPLNLHMDFLSRYLD